MIKKTALWLSAVFICLPLYSAEPELFYSSGRHVTAAAGTYAAGAYFIEPGIVVFAAEKSSFTHGKKGINLKSGELYIENFSKQPMIPVKSGKMQIIEGGRAFRISASEKSLEAVKGITSLKFGATEASLPEGRKFINGKIEQGSAAAAYRGYAAVYTVEKEGRGLEGLGGGIKAFIRPGIIETLVADGQTVDADISVKLKASVKAMDYSLSGIVSAYDGGQPVMIFSEGKYVGPALMRLEQAAAREITAAVHEIEKRGFINGRETAVVFDSVDAGLMAKAETVLKSVPGVKKIEKESLYGKKTIFKITTRADGYMIADMIKGRISGLKPVKTFKNKVVF